MGWLIALGIVIALALLPLGISLRYDAEGFRIRLLAGLLSIPLSGKQEKPKKAKKQKQQTKKGKKKASSSTSSQPQEKQNGGSLSDFLPFVQLAVDFLDTFRRKLRIRRLEMKLIMAADDPCDLAVNYGRAWAALGNLMPQLERCFVIKKRDLEVEGDFEASNTVITARLDLTITLGRLLHLLVHHGLRGLKEFINFKKLRKGGAPK